jgi:glucose-6-phosphate 1-epimerase
VTELSSELPSLAVCNRHARARIYLQGAHVAAFRPVGEGEVIWMSSRSWFQAGKPIRGGVPICFPWFGAHAERSELPGHGFARLEAWRLIGAEELPDARTRVVLGLESSPETRASWPHDFSLRYTVTVGPTLELALEVRNTGGAPFSYEEALHTYLDVGDVRRARVLGLAGARFIDKADGGARKVEGEAVSFTAETDRLYLDTTARCLVEDPALGRRLVVDKEGSQSSVVWNPWIAKAARMPDFADEEWPGMVCVETANAGENRVTLGAGAAHVMTARLAAERPAR